jgi:prevent-host-death family protein
MADVPEIVPVTDLRQNAAKVLKRVRRSRDPVVITQRGRAAGVLLSFDQYQRQLRERDVLRALARGEKEIQEGEGYGLDEVLAEADNLLGATRP